VLKTNFSLSLKLLDWCTKSRTPFIYASSAATYGDGEGGFPAPFAAHELREKAETISGTSS
jgi:ADP-L-glycero-D-manno-heptose 6-epimerase